MNIDGLTNKELLLRALRQLIDEAERGDFEDGLYSCFHPQQTIEAAHAAILEVDRPKKRRIPNVR
jgi:hypothetical protein